jgi:hypothetical protein
MMAKPLVSRVAKGPLSPPWGPQGDTIIAQVSAGDWVRRESSLRNSLQAALAEAECYCTLISVMDGTL